MIDSLSILQDSKKSTTETFYDAYDVGSTLYEEPTTTANIIRKDDPQEISRRLRRIKRRLFLRRVHNCTTNDTPESNGAATKGTEGVYSETVGNEASCEKNSVFRPSPASSGPQETADERQGDGMLPTELNGKNAFDEDSTKYTLIKPSADISKSPKILDACEDAVLIWKNEHKVDLQCIMPKARSLKDKGKKNVNTSTSSRNYSSRAA